MLKLGDVYARKKEASAQVSTQTRTLAFGFLGISWALLTAHDDPLKSMVGHVPTFLLLVLAIGAVVVLILDMLQYVAITSMADATYHRAEKEGETEGILYNPKSTAYRAQACLYHAKFVMLWCVAGVLLVIFIMLFQPIHTLGR